MYLHNAKQVVLDSGLITLTASRPTGWVSYYETSKGAEHETSFEATPDGWYELAVDLGLESLVERKVELKFWARPFNSKGKHQVYTEWVAIDGPLDLRKSVLPLYEKYEHIFWPDFADDFVSSDMKHSLRSASSLHDFAEKHELTFETAAEMAIRGDLPFPSKGYL